MAVAVGMGVSVGIGVFVGWGVSVGACVAVKVADGFWVRVWVGGTAVGSVVGLGAACGAQAPKNSSRQAIIQIMRFICHPYSDSIGDVTHEWNRLWAVGFVGNEAVLKIEVQLHECFLLSSLLYCGSGCCTSKLRVLMLLVMHRRPLATEISTCCTRCDYA